MADSVSSATSSSSSTGLRTQATGSTTLGKNEFLKLLTAQLANQDPLAPTDNQAFIAQLAQFSSVEQAEATNTRLDSLILAQAANNQTAVASLVGKDLVFKTGTVTLAAGEPANFSGELSANAASVTAIITDSNGKQIAKVPANSTDAGTVTFTWNGKDVDGNPVAAGSYKVQLVAADKNGASIDITQRGRGRVSSVSFEDGVPKLVVDGTKIAMSDVLEVAEPAATASTN